MRLGRSMTDPQSGWVTLRGPSSRRLLRSPAPLRRASFGFIAIIVGMQFVVRFILTCLLDHTGWTGVIVFLVVIVLAGLSAYLFLTSAKRWPRVNLDAGILRVGRTEIPFDKISDATYIANPHRDHHDDYLGIGTSVENSAYVCVRSPHMPELSTAEREVLAEVLRRSSVVIPEAVPDRFDPAGKFAWMDHPNSLTKTEAIDYVLRTPASGEPERTARSTG